MPAFPALRIAVIGSGNIGSAFAFQLAQTSGHDVTVVARPHSARLHQLQRDNGIVNVAGGRAAVTVTDSLDERIAYDVVIVTVMAHQVDALVPALQRSAAHRILFVFNNFEPERLRAVIGTERCDFGMPFIQASLDQEGRLNAKIGAGGQKTRLSQQRWVDVFNAAGLPAVMEPNMLLWLRCQVPLCVAFESVSVTSVRRGGGATWTEAMVLARGVHESYALIQGLGQQVYPSGKAWLKASPYWVMAAVLWSVSRIKSFRELLAGGVEECRALINVMTSAANAENVRVDIANIEAMRPPQ